MQTDPTSSPSNLPDDEQTDQLNHIGTMDLRQIVEDQEKDNIFLTIDQSTTKHEDENNNDQVDPRLIQLPGPSSAEDLDTKASNQQSTNDTNLFHSNTESTTEPQSSSESNRGEDALQTTTHLSTDNDNRSKR